MAGTNATKMARFPENRAVGFHRALVDIRLRGDVLADDEPAPRHGEDPPHSSMAMRA